MPPVQIPNESEAALLRQMCATLDEENPSISLFEPMLDDGDGMWFSTQVFTVPEGDHPIQVIRELCQPGAAEFRNGARAVGLVTFGHMLKLPKGMGPEEFMALEAEGRQRLPRVRVRTQVVVAGPFAWGKTITLDNEGVIDVPATIEEPVETSPLIEACQYLLALAVGIVPDPPTGGEG